MVKIFCSVVSFGFVVNTVSLDALVDCEYAVVELAEECSMGFVLGGAIISNGSLVFNS